MRAATALGLGLGRCHSGGDGLFWRRLFHTYCEDDIHRYSVNRIYRYNGFEHAVYEKKKMKETNEENKAKENIYLRFKELTTEINYNFPNTSNKIVRPIRLDLSSINNNNKDTTVCLLSEEMLISGNCTGEGFPRPRQSQATQAYFEIEKHENAVHHFWETLSHFMIDKSHPVQGCDHSSSHAKFNWINPIPAPPFILRRCCNFGIALLNRGKKILVWEVEKPGVLACYDDDFPEKTGWTRVYPCLGDKLPFINFHGKKPFFVEDHDPDIGDFHLMFNYEPDKEPLCVSAYFLSNKFDTFQPITGKPIQLPELCLEYIFKGESDSKHAKLNICSDFEFLHLGNRKFGLVLNKFFEDYHDEGKNAGFILLVAFEYDIKPNLEVEARILLTRRFQYHASSEYPKKDYYSEDPPYPPGPPLVCSRPRIQIERDYSKTLQVHLDGAFLLSFSSKRS